MTLRIETTAQVRLRRSDRAMLSLSHREIGWRRRGSDIAGSSARSMLWHGND
jgi:hypothetical protein